MTFKKNLVLAAIGAAVMSTSAIAETLRMSTWLPPEHHLVADTIPRWIAAIEAASGGTLKIKLDPAPIAGPAAQYDIVRDGAADMSYHVVAYTPGPFEVLRGIELPFLSPSAKVGSQAVYDWFDRNVGFDTTYPDVKTLAVTVHGPGAIHTKDPVASLDDLKGVKLRVGGGGVRLAEGLGAVPVALPATQSYEALHTGVVDGIMITHESIEGFKLGKLVPHHLDVPGGLYTTALAFFMNLDRWNSLSDEHKALLIEYGGVKAGQIMGQGWDDADVDGKAYSEKNGGTFNTLSDADAAAWAEQVSFLETDWVAMANEKGLDGAALLEDLKATIAKFSAAD